MELDSFAQKIREQFIEDDISLIGITTNFRTLDTWDSLTAMAILTIIADDFGVEIPVEDFKKLTTIQELFEFVNSGGNK